MASLSLREPRQVLLNDEAGRLAADGYPDANFARRQLHLDGTRY